MLCSLSVFVLLLLSGASQKGNIGDFSDHINGYEYIFHGEHDLFLVIHGGSCYFFPVKDGMEYSTLDTWHKEHTENFVRTLIEGSDPRYVQRSGLDQVREAYMDVLADFRCADKAIFQVDLSDYRITTPEPFHFWDPFGFFSHHIHRFFHGK